MSSSHIKNIVYLSSDSGGFGSDDTLKVASGAKGSWKNDND